MILVLGLVVRPYAVPCASLACDRMVNCGPCDAMPGGCPHALACAKLISQEATAAIAGFYWYKVDWETGSCRLAGVEVPSQHPPPIANKEVSD